MKNLRNRKGFTIVELVIVIAVIAVLAGVMIPTFSGIIETANKSADTQLVAQINTILYVEKELGGGVNDAVEIQKIIKENGLKLKTKTKGAYLWYDTEKVKVVLAGLNSDGIVLDEKDKDVNDAPSKGKFRATVNSPEAFVNGYLFISEESNDGLAESVCALRNAENADGIQTALAAISEINGSLGVKLTSFMDTAAVVKADGSIIPPSGGASAAKVAIVSSDMTTVKASTLTGTGSLADYTGIKIVDFHSGVVAFENEDTVLAAMKAASQIKFCYNSDSVGRIDAADEAANEGVKNNLISPTERKNLVVSLNLVYLDQSGEFDYVNNVGELELPDSVDDDFVINSDFPYLIYEGTAADQKVYDFVAYSFYDDGSNPIPFGTTGYKLDDYDKLLSKSENGQNVLTVYAIFRQQDPDFKVTAGSGDGCGDGCGGNTNTDDGAQFFSSGAITYKLFTAGQQDLGEITITVLTKTARIDGSMIGRPNVELKIPSNVTLHIPYEGAEGPKTKTDDVMQSGTYDATFDKLTATGERVLTIATGVTIKNEGRIFIDAKLYNKDTPYQCFINNSCGILQLENGSKIESTGSIYSYGITRGVDESGTGINGSGAEGEGEIVALGGTVTEIFTLLDWHGGSDASACINTQKITPFHNWVVDNIRAKLTIHSGTKYTASGAVHTSAGNSAVDLVLIDVNNNNNPLFVTEEAAILQKTYDDGYNLAILQGTVSDAETKVSVPASIFTITAKFNEIAMPISNFDIVVSEGATLNITNNVYKILPGSNITVNGTLNVNTKVVVYDSFKRISDVTEPCPYPAYDPARIVVNGTVNFLGGSFAGEILPGNENAKIVVKNQVGAASFREGFEISDVWHEAQVEGCPTNAILNGVTQNLVVGTYTVKTGGVGGALYSWVAPQPSEN